MIPKEKVEAIVSKHNSIEKELSSGNVDPKKLSRADCLDLIKRSKK